MLTDRTAPKIGHPATPDVGVSCPTLRAPPAPQVVINRV